MSGTLMKPASYFEPPIVWGREWNSVLHLVLRCSATANGSECGFELPSKKRLGLVMASVIQITPEWDSDSKSQLELLSALD